MTLFLAHSCHDRTGADMAGKRLPRGIDRLPSGTYRARLTVDNIVHTIGTFGTIGDARAALDIARAEKARGTFTPPAIRRERLKAEQAARRAQADVDARTVRELAEAWLQWHRERGLKIGSVYTYQRHLEAHFLPEYGDRRVSDVTALELNEWLDALERASGADAAARIHRDVFALFKFATGDAAELPRGFTPWLLTSPVPPLAARKLRRPNLPTRNRDALAAEDVAALAGHMSYPEDRLIVLLSGWAALRLGEVLALRRRHFQADDDGVLWLRVESQVQARGSGVREDTPKSAAGFRAIPVPSAIHAATVAHLAEHTGPDPDALLFPRRGPGNRLNNPNTIRKRFNAALDVLNRERVRAGGHPVEDFTFHGLRHTALTRLGQAGATTAELRAYAGHSDSKSVEIYQHAERGRLAALADKMGATGT